LVLKRGRTHSDRLLRDDVEGDGLDAALALGDDLLEVLAAGRVAGGGDDADVGVAGELADSLEPDAAKRGGEQLTGVSLADRGRLCVAGEDNVPRGAGDKDDGRAHDFG
jgi:hypothetical protein